MKKQYYEILSNLLDKGINKLSVFDTLKEEKMNKAIKELKERKLSRDTIIFIISDISNDIYRYYDGFSAKDFIKITDAVHAVQREYLKKYGKG